MNLNMSVGYSIYYMSELQQKFSISFPHVISCVNVNLRSHPIRTKIMHYHKLECKDIFYLQQLIVFLSLALFKINSSISITDRPSSGFTGGSVFWIILSINNRISLSWP